jgi:hypothetical protein
MNEDELNNLADALNGHMAITLETKLRLEALIELMISELSKGDAEKKILLELAYQKRVDEKLNNKTDSHRKLMRDNSTTED